jgi:hypothetical protein
MKLIPVYLLEAVEWLFDRAEMLRNWLRPHKQVQPEPREKAKAQNA